MGRPLNVCDGDDLMRVIHERNVACSSRFLAALTAAHSDLAPAPPEPEPFILAPIPNEMIAAAHADHVISVRDIQLFVCKEFNVSLADMLSERRKKEVVRSRQVAVYLSKQLTSLSLPSIGRRFFRDHTTILFSIRRIELLVEADPVFAARINRLEERLGS